MAAPSFILWHLDLFTHPPFQDAAAIMTAVTTSDYSAAFNNALEWLRTDVADQFGARRGDVLEVLRKYAPFFEGMRDVGPPLAGTVENGWCDGCKLLQGYYEGYVRKSKFLKAKRAGLGVLDKPGHVLATGTKGGLPIAAWVQVPSW